ncbi:hypothetical protein OGAPHI_000418 [Ogataea philodendri]|uniref:Uncharacterized protein n=1 Tax=Ogataea philodendri TaxID=1378263 RepID=A0A9P8PG84_9ASCO|nr:uncharacterized protein OGAPHI_000418 [Ogataea philodendri]KAH3671713.1 hypothetical protein OGAPHI_000418 [Ogataea philodendri]
MKSLFHSKNRSTILWLAILLVIGVFYLIPRSSEVEVEDELNSLAKPSVGSSPRNTLEEDFVLESKLTTPEVVNNKQSSKKEEQELGDRAEIQAINKEVSKLTAGSENSFELDEKVASKDSVKEKPRPPKSNKKPASQDSEYFDADEQHAEVFDEPSVVNKNLEEATSSSTQPASKATKNFAAKHKGTNQSSRSKPKADVKPENEKSDSSKRPASLKKVSDNRILGNEEALAEPKKAPAAASSGQSEQSEQSEQYF